MQGTRLAIGCLIVLAGGCTRADREAAVPGDQKDSAFAAVQERGAEVMGVDQYTSAHVFEPLPDGGRIVLQREVPDSAGVAVIRAHMADIARRFAAGDFTLPGVVHATEVPGTAVMAGKRTVIRYVADTLPRGGQVRIWTTDSVALAAVHEFLAFQRMDHRAAAHESTAPQH
ncbi:MAG TPA: hypothetical protein VFO06_08720 [Gemmatimonadales bacterium]|nr:hypothetical protein [Gemmatimonadales bacterium]